MKFEIEKAYSAVLETVVYAVYVDGVYHRSHDSEKSAQDYCDKLANNPAPF